MFCPTLQKTIQATLERNKKNTYWDGSVFEELVKLGNDERGSWGEETFASYVTTLTTKQLCWDGDRNHNTLDGVYDMFYECSKLLQKVRIEQKTAFRGSKGNWQHEGIYDSCMWDRLVLFDVDYSTVFVTILKYEEVDFDERHVVFQNKMHLRKNESNKYKWDFGTKQLSLGQEYGLTFALDANSPDNKKFANFIQTRL
jgi:hypothetical protein